MTAPTGLRRTQRWFLDRLQLRRPHSLPPADAVVLPSATLSACERMHIYERMYLARLEECLVADFPVVRALVGERRFSLLAEEFVTAEPPSSWTLNDLGAGFPAFLARRRGVPRAALVHDVARLERAVSEAFDAEAATPMTKEDAARVSPAAWARTRLLPVPSLRVLALATHANRAVVSVREDERVPGRLPRGPSWIAVWRKDLRVWRLELSRPMHAALAALVRGRPLASAVAAAARADDGDAEDLADRVRRAFATWIDEGFFAGVGTEPRRRGVRSA